MTMSLSALKLSKNKKILYKVGWVDEHGDLTEKGSEVLEMINQEALESKMVEYALQVLEESKNDSRKKN